MKILRVIASMNPSSGGPCQGIRNITPVLKSMGIATEVVSLDDSQESFLGKDNFKIIALGPGRTPYRYAKNLYDWLLKNLYSYDVVIIHGVWLYNSFGTFKAWQAVTKEVKKNT